MNRRLTCILLAAAACAGFAAAHAQEARYPSRPIRLVVGYPPGGATDIVARTLAARMQETLGQPLVVDNKPGATSNIGSELVAKAVPDGYTLLLGTIANATNMTAYRNPGYDTLRDFAPITQTMSAPSVLAVHPSTPARTLRELIELARRSPGRLTFASSGTGGSPHLAGELLKLRAGIDILHVPYKGATPAMTDLLGGQVTMGFQTALSAIPHLQSGKLSVIAVAASRRMAQLPGVPTMAEAGLPDFEVSSWNGLFAPAKTPPEILARLREAAVRALGNAEMRDKLAAQGAEPVGSSPEEFRAYVRAEIDKWAKVIRASGMPIE
ncbi:MAG: tripartite tricarboxylate transporter substrate binding protein [Burkholderiales bacterium]|nr:tripartite tricarboxylate transporter substrate binding protein [Burkholderiales bacterium]